MAALEVGRMPRFAVLCAAIVALILLTPPTSAQAFGPHEDITEEGLAGNNGRTYVPRGALRVINDQHAWSDNWFRKGLDRRHFDDCEFDGGSSNIRGLYSDARDELVEYDLFEAYRKFGRALHGVQDFYSHSNWVELGFPRGRTVRQSDLVDLSGAQESVRTRWRAPADGGVVRDDILLANDSWAGIPAGWSIEHGGEHGFVPTLYDESGTAVGRLLMSGTGAADHECVVPFADGSGLADKGYTHDDLNKDSSGTPNHEQARKLATLQTSYEWCRLVAEAASVGRAGVLLALTVKPGVNPHPANTPCAENSLGAAPHPVTVTIESVQVLNGHDDDDEADVQLAAVLYADPLNFRRSVHATNKGARIYLRDGEIVPSDRLPEPLSMCVPRGSRVSFALHGWDNDDDSDEKYGAEYDDIWNDDDVIIGHSGGITDFRDPSVVHTYRSDDMVVRFRVSQTANRLEPAACVPDLKIG